MKAWQRHLFSCFNNGVGYKPYPEPLLNAWRHATWDAFVHDTIVCNGTQMATILSMVYSPDVIVEFGLDAGLTTLQFCKLNPDAEVHGVDSNQINYNTGRAICCHAIANNPRNLTLHFMNSFDFVMPGRVGLCFIDADHIGDAPWKDSWRAWENRNVAGDWCIAWDDYHPNNPDVKSAVDRFVADVEMELHQIGSWFYIGTKPHSEVEALQILDLIQVMYNE